MDGLGSATQDGDMGSSISVLYGGEESEGVALEMEEQPATPQGKQQQQQRDVGTEVDLESPRSGADTAAGKAAALVAQLTTDDEKELDSSQLATLSAMLAVNEDDDFSVDDTVREVGTTLPLPPPPPLPPDLTPCARVFPRRYAPCSRSSARCHHLAAR
eukprot:COSAG02_NODE_63_length_43286_cov_54.666412_24_plen_159_part_00